MNTEQVLEKLTTQFSAISKLQDENCSSAIFERWYDNTVALLERIPVKGEIYRNKFNLIEFEDYVGTIPPHRKLNNAECYQRGMKRARRLLQSIIDEIQEYGVDAPKVEIDQNALQIIENICNRFHWFVRNLNKTIHHKKQTCPKISVENEYDVQYLLQGILSLYFDDIRDEEPTPTLAGSSSKADFLLFNEKVIIECKHTRSSLSQHDLKVELMTDIGDYQTHKDCQTIVFFIYDPSHLIKNPPGFESDFNIKTTDVLTIKALIRPSY